MKFAAKRTWPEKASSWEHEGEADSIEAFATEFASIEQLAVDSEMVVMTKEGGPSSQFFKVTGTSPYTLGPADQRSAAAPAASTAESVEETSEVEPVGMPSLSPVISMLFYMGKVAVTATLVIAAMAVGITYLKHWLGG